MRNRSLPSTISRGIPASRARHADDSSILQTRFHHFGERTPESIEGCFRQPIAGRFGIELGLKQDFRAEDVSDSGDHRLIEQQRTDRLAAAGDPVPHVDLLSAGKRVGTEQRQRSGPVARGRSLGTCSDRSSQLPRRTPSSACELFRPVWGAASCVVETCRNDRDERGRFDLPQSDRTGACRRLGPTRAFCCSLCGPRDETALAGW